MYAPDKIKEIYKRFDSFPMETLTKAWFAKHNNGGKQRSVELMKEHRERYGITGNCFDLALWLLHEFHEAGITAYPIGHDIHTDRAHVAVVAVNSENKRYLCDLGDQWLQPILIDKTESPLPFFFPAANISVMPQTDEVIVQYHRPNGKVSRQSYNLEPIQLEEFLIAADRSQQLIWPKPLLEVRLPYKEETAHWEFYNWDSFLSTTEGILNDAPCSTIEEWANRIGEKTGYDQDFLIEALSIYGGLRDD